jgi:hypothetical protein
MTPLEALWWLLVGHAVMDFWAQSDALAQMKNRNRPNTRIPPGQKPQTMWPYALTAHALHHGAAVAVVLGSPLLGALETVSHWIIDFGKCENWYGIHADQALHAFVKVVLLWMWWTAFR